MSRKTKKIFKIIADAPAMLERLHELTGNELKLWLYFWLRTGKELTSFPGNKTIAAELKIDLNTVKAAKRGLREKGWTNRESQKIRDDGGLSTVVEKVHLPWAKNQSEGRVKNTTDASEENLDGGMGGKIDQQKEYSEEVAATPYSGANQNSNEEQFVSSLAGSRADALSVPCACGAADDEEAEAPHQLPKSKTEDSSKAEEEEQNQEQDQTPQLEAALDHMFYKLADASGNPAVFMDRIVSLTGDLPAAFGLESFAPEQMCQLPKIAYLSLQHKLGTDAVADMALWAKTHKFWQHRLRTLENLGSFMENTTESGIVAQYRTYRAVLERKDNPRKVKAVADWV